MPISGVGDQGLGVVMSHGESPPTAFGGTPWDSTAISAVAGLFHGKRFDDANCPFHVKPVFSGIRRVHVDGFHVKRVAAAAYGCSSWTSGSDGFMPSARTVLQFQQASKLPGTVCPHELQRQLARLS